MLVSARGGTHSRVPFAVRERCIQCAELATHGMQTRAMHLDVACTKAMGQNKQIQRADVNRRGFPA